MYKYVLMFPFFFSFLLIILTDMKKVNRYYMNDDAVCVRSSGWQWHIYISCSTNGNLLKAYGTDSIKVKCGYNLMRNASYEWNANAYHFRCGYWRYLRLICDLFPKPGHSPLCKQKQQQQQNPSNSPCNHRWFWWNWCCNNHQTWRKDLIDVRFVFGASTMLVTGCVPNYIGLSDS